MLARLVLVTILLGAVVAPGAVMFVPALFEPEPAYPVLGAESPPAASAVNAARAASYTEAAQALLRAEPDATQRPCRLLARALQLDAQTGRDLFVRHCR